MSTRVKPEGRTLRHVSLPSYNEDEIIRRQEDLNDRTISKPRVQKRTRIQYLLPTTEDVTVQLPPPIVATNVSSPDMSPPVLSATVLPSSIVSEASPKGLSHGLNEASVKKEAGVGTPVFDTSLNAAAPTEVPATTIVPTPVVTPTLTTPPAPAPHAKLSLAALARQQRSSRRHLPDVSSTDFSSSTLVSASSSSAVLTPPSSSQRSRARARVETVPLTTEQLAASTFRAYVPVPRAAVVSEAAGDVTPLLLPPLMFPPVPPVLLAAGADVALHLLRCALLALTTNPGLLQQQPDAPASSYAFFLLDQLFTLLPPPGALLPSDAHLTAGAVFAAARDWAREADVALRAHIAGDFRNAVPHPVARTPDGRLAGGRAVAASPCAQPYGFFGASLGPPVPVQARAPTALPQTRSWSGPAPRHFPVEDLTDEADVADAHTALRAAAYTDASTDDAHAAPTPSSPAALAVVDAEPAKPRLPEGSVGARLNSAALATGVLAGLAGLAGGTNVTESALFVDPPQPTTTPVYWSLSRRSEGGRGNRLFSSVARALLADADEEYLLRAAVQRHLRLHAGAYLRACPGLRHLHGKDRRPAWELLLADLDSADCYSCELYYRALAHVLQMDIELRVHGLSHPLAVLPHALLAPLATHTAQTPRRLVLRLQGFPASALAACGCGAGSAAVFAAILRAKHDFMHGLRAEEVHGWTGDDRQRVRAQANALQEAPLDDDSDVEIIVDDDEDKRIDTSHTIPPLPPLQPQPPPPVQGVIHKEKREKKEKKERKDKKDKREKKEKKEQKERKDKKDKKERGAHDRSDPPCGDPLPRTP